LLTSESYPSGRALRYAYDEGARLSQLSEGTTIYASGLSYEPHGGLTGETFGNGAVHSMGYNRALQASEIKLKQSANGAELQRFNYSYGAVNQADGSVDTTKNNGQIGRIDSYIDGAKQWDQRFSYDSLGRLSTAAEYQQGNNNQLTWQTQYTFDRYGNRFQSGSANVGFGYTPVLTSDINEANNRFIASGPTPVAYDPAGNIISDAKFRGMSYSYDANGRQTFAERDDHTNQQTSVYDCAGQRVQTTVNGTTRQMVYDIFGQNVADYVGSSGTMLERENIYRGGQLLATFETGAASTPTGLAATAESGSITLNWSAASGVGNYRVERKGAGGAYNFLSATSLTTLTDSGASLGSAYLYRVCAADGTNNCTSAYSNIVLGARLNFPTDPAITTSGDDSSGQTVTTMKAAHITELRTAVNSVRSLAGLPAATWTHSTLTPSVTEISKDDVNELRTKLDEALTALGVRTSNWIDHPLAGAPNGTLIRGVQVTQLRQCATNGNSCYKPIAQFVKDFYQGALHRQPTASELSTWTATLGQAQAQGSGQLLTAAQSLGSTLFNSGEYGGVGTSNAQFVADLYTGYLQRTHDLEGHNFWLSILNSDNDRAHLILAFAVSGEFGSNVAALCAAPATGGGVRYVLSDVQGSSRAVMNNGTYGSSAIIARHDYRPFGEEIWAGTGQRTTTQSYNATDKLRQKYAQTERDAVTGLDHTPWRKYDSFAGRWTSPDPYMGSMSIGDPQSFNRYSYVQNDPVNFADPSGLCTFNITINGVTNRTQLQAMQTEIRRIFGAANQTVIFNQATAAGVNTNTSFTLNVQKAGNPGHPDAPGWTPVTIDSYVTGSGFASTDVLTAAIQRSSDSALRALGMTNGNFGLALGRVAAHEAGHHFLQLIGKHPSEGLMQQYGADWWRTGSSYEARFRFTAAQAQQLSQLCPQAPRHPTTNHELLHGIGGGGGGIGPAFFGGGGYPSWWYSMQGFLDFVNSIPVGGGGYVTVSACVGSDCYASTLGHEHLHSR
jgi:RHS repeat-associated protein